MNSNNMVKDIRSSNLDTLHERSRLMRKIRERLTDDVTLVLTQGRDCTEPFMTWGAQKHPYQPTTKVSIFVQGRTITTIAHLDDLIARLAPRVPNVLERLHWSRMELVERQSESLSEEWRKKCDTSTASILSGYHDPETMCDVIFSTPLYQPVAAFKEHVSARIRLEYMDWVHERRVHAERAGLEKWARKCIARRINKNIEAIKTKVWRPDSPNKCRRLDAPRGMREDAN